MSGESANRQNRMAEAVRQIVTRRERAPRSPKMERALKRLLWRYSRAGQDQKERESVDVQE